MNINSEINKVNCLALFKYILKCLDKMCFYKSSVGIYYLFVFIIKTFEMSLLKRRKGVILIFYVGKGVILQVLLLR